MKRLIFYDEQFQLLTHKLQVPPTRHQANHHEYLNASFSVQVPEVYVSPQSKHKKILYEKL